MIKRLIYINEVKKIPVLKQKVEIHNHIHNLSVDDKERSHAKKIEKIQIICQLLLNRDSINLIYEFRDSLPYL